MVTDSHGRRFGGINRLYGQQALETLASTHVIVVGIGGVGSWATEALARSGVGRLTLIDLDHVAESNFNRQLHATQPTLGQAKVLAMAERIALINPDCQVHGVDDFLTPENVATLIGNDPNTLVLDAMDHVPAKVALVDWCRRHHQGLVVCGAAGGKLRAEGVQVADLSQTTQDPLLSKVRSLLRRHHGFPSGQAQSGSKSTRQAAKFGVTAIFSTEAVKRPETDPDNQCEVFSPGASPLACAGYGSLVSVTAVFGLVAAGCVIDAAIKRNKG